MSVKAKIIAKAVIGGIQAAALLWATGFWVGMGLRHGQKEADWLDDMADDAITKHAYKQVLKDFMKENKLSKKERKEMFNRMFQIRRQAKAEGWTQGEIEDAEADILVDYQKTPPAAKEEEKE